jgi:DNA transposition AAA+ family ATPase
LAAGSRPIFVDEADYLLRQPAMIDALRDVYDTTGSPVILIGMEDMARKVRSIGKFARRVTQWIEFSGIDAADARTLADTVCEVRVDDGLLAHLAKEARANIGRMTTALARIETFARTNSLDSVTLADWGARPLFFDQPEFGRKR